MFALRIVTVDHYMAVPIRGLDECYSEFRCSEIKQVPVIRIFGSTPAGTEDMFTTLCMWEMSSHFIDSHFMKEGSDELICKGQKTCLHLHGIFPYICVPFEAADSWEKYAYQLVISLDKALNIAMGNVHGSVQYVFKVSLISGVPFYGYHPNENKFLKIYFYNPLIVKKAVELLENGAVMNHLFQPHEAHIPYILQMFIDYNLYGMNFIYLSRVKFRQKENGESCTVSESNSLQSSNIEKKIWNKQTITKDLFLPDEVKFQSRCELEIDSIDQDILNKELIKLSSKNPGIEAIWADERIRRRNQGDPSQISVSSSQDRDHILETESEKKHKQALLSIITSWLAKAENSPTQETSKNKLNPYAQNEKNTTESEEILEIKKINKMTDKDLNITLPIVNEEITLSLNSKSSSQRTVFLDSQDEELVQLLANVNMTQSAVESLDYTRILSTQTKQHGENENETDDNNDDKEIWEMSQEIWETELNLLDDLNCSNKDKTIIHSNDHKIDLNCMDNNDDDGGDDEDTDIPQLDGPVDPKFKKSDIYSSPLHLNSPRRQLTACKNAHENIYLNHETVTYAVNSNNCLQNSSNMSITRFEYSANAVCNDNPENACAHFWNCRNYSWNSNKPENEITPYSDCYNQRTANPCKKYPNGSAEWSPMLFPPSCAVEDQVVNYNPYNSYSNIPSNPCHFSFASGSNELNTVGSCQGNGNFFPNPSFEPYQENCSGRNPCNLLELQKPSSLDSSAINYNSNVEMNASKNYISLQRISTAARDYREAWMDIPHHDLTLTNCSTSHNTLTSLLPTSVGSYDHNDLVSADDLMLTNSIALSLQNIGSTNSLKNPLIPEINTNGFNMANSSDPSYQVNENKLVYSDTSISSQNMNCANTVASTDLPDMSSNPVQNNFKDGFQFSSMHLERNDITDKHNNTTTQPLICSSNGMNAKKIPYVDGNEVISLSHNEKNLETNNNHNSVILELIEDIVNCSVNMHANNNIADNEEIIRSECMTVKQRDGSNSKQKENKNDANSDENNSDNNETKTELKVCVTPFVAGKTRRCKASKQRVPALEQLASFISDSSSSRSSLFNDSYSRENTKGNHLATEESSELTSDAHLNVGKVQSDLLSSNEKLNKRTQVIRNLRLSRLSLKTKQKEENISPVSQNICSESPISREKEENVPKEKKYRSAKLRLRDTNNKYTETEKSNGVYHSIEKEKQNETETQLTKLSPNKSSNSVGTNTQHSGLLYCSRKGFYLIKYGDLKVNIPKYVKITDLLKLGHEKLSLSNISRKEFKNLYPERRKSSLKHNFSRHSFDVQLNKGDQTTGCSKDSCQSLSSQVNEKLTPKKQRCWELQQHSKSGLKILLKVQNHHSSSEESKETFDKTLILRERDISKSTPILEHKNFPTKQKKTEVSKYVHVHDKNCSENEKGQNTEYSSKELSKENEGIATSRARRTKVDYSPNAFLPILHFDNIISDVKQKQQRKPFSKCEKSNEQKFDYKSWPSLQVKIEKLNLNSYPKVESSLGKNLEGTFQSKLKDLPDKIHDPVKLCDSQCFDIKNEQKVNTEIKHFPIASDIDNYQIRKRKLSLTKYKLPKKTRIGTSSKNSPLKERKLEKKSKTLELTPKKSRFPELKIIISPFSKKIKEDCNEKDFPIPENLSKKLSPPTDDLMPCLTMMSPKLISCPNDQDKLRKTTDASSCDSNILSDPEEESFPPVLEREDSVLEKNKFSHIFMSPPKDGYIGKIGKNTKEMKLRLKRRQRRSKDESIDSEYESPLLHRNVDVSELESNESNGSTDAASHIQQDAASHIQQDADNTESSSGIVNKITGKISVEREIYNIPHTSHDESKKLETIYEDELNTESNEKNEVSMKKVNPVLKEPDNLYPPDLDEEGVDLEPMQLDDTYNSANKLDESEDSEGIEDSLMLSDFSENSSSPVLYQNQDTNEKWTMEAEFSPMGSEMPRSRMELKEYLDNLETLPTKTCENDEIINVNSMDIISNASQHCIKIDDKFCKEYLCESVLSSNLNQPGCSKWGENNFNEGSESRESFSNEMECSSLKKFNPTLTDRSNEFINDSQSKMTENLGKINIGESVSCSPAVLESSQDLFSPVSLSPPPLIPMENRWEDISSDENGDSSDSQLPELIDQKATGKVVEISQHCVSNHQPTVYSTSLVKFLREESRPNNFASSNDEGKGKNSNNLFDSDKVCHEEESCMNCSPTDSPSPINSSDENKKPDNILNHVENLSEISEETADHSDGDLFDSIHTQENDHDFNKLNFKPIPNKIENQIIPFTMDITKETEIFEKDKHNISRLKIAKAEEETHKENKLFTSPNEDFLQCSLTDSLLCKNYVSLADHDEIKSNSSSHCSKFPDSNNITKNNVPKLFVNTNNYLEIVPSSDTLHVQMIEEGNLTGNNENVSEEILSVEIKNILDEISEKCCKIENTKMIQNNKTNAREAEMIQSNKTDATEAEIKAVENFSFIKSQEKTEAEEIINEGGKKENFMELEDSLVEKSYQKLEDKEEIITLNESFNEIESFVINQTTNKETALAVSSLLNLYNHSFLAIERRDNFASQVSQEETLVNHTNLSDNQSETTIVSHTNQNKESKLIEKSFTNNYHCSAENLSTGKSIQNSPDYEKADVPLMASVADKGKRHKGYNNILAFALKPPSFKEVADSLHNLEVTVVKHKDAFCSDPKDIPEKYNDFSSHSLRIASEHLADLPEFEGRFQKDGLENWRTVLAAHFGLEFENTGLSILKEIKKNCHMRSALIQNKNSIVITPNLPPPSYKSVAKWAVKHLNAPNALQMESENLITCGNKDPNETFLSVSSDVGSLEQINEIKDLTESSIEKAELSVICEEETSFKNVTDISKTSPESRMKNISPLFLNINGDNETDSFPIHSTPIALEKSFCNGHERVLKNNNQSATVNKRTSNELHNNEDSSCTNFTIKKRFKHDSQKIAKIKNKYLSYYSTKQRKFRTDKIRNHFKKKFDDIQETSRTPSPILAKKLPSPSISGISSQASPHLASLSPNNTYDFKVSYHNLQDAKNSDEHQFLTTLSVELHINTREDLKPDPEFDPVLALFYSFHNDVPVYSSTPQELNGAIIVDKMVWESCLHCQNRTEFHNDNNKEELSVVGRSIKNISSFPSSNECCNRSSKRNLLAKTGIHKIDMIYVPSEEVLFRELATLIERWDPDILVGYEIQMLSWGYLFQRSSVIGIDLKSSLSRIIGSSVSNCSLSDASENDFLYVSEMNVTGRIVLNLWRLMKHEAALTSYTFENAVYHILHKRIPRFSFRTLTEWFSKKTDTCRWRVVEYYMTRVKGNFDLIAHVDLIGRTSELARLFGIQFLEVLTRGSQFRVESMMLRTARPFKYIAVSPSIQQRARMRAPECIQLVMEPESKFYSNPVLVLDFQSLYPSIIIAYNYCFSTCLGRIDALREDDETYEFGCTSMKLPLELLKTLFPDNITVSPVGVAFVKSSIRKGILPRMLEEILETRIMVKSAMKKCIDDKAMHKILNARQLGLKLIANVTYGYTAANFSGRMPCVEVGDSIVSKSRETLERAIHLVVTNKSWNAQVVYGDTDSLFVHLPGRSKEAAFRIGQEIADAVTADNPKPVKLKFEKVYLPCVLQTKKRYVGYMYESLDQKEPIFDAKGNEVIRRDGCPAVVKILEKSLKLLFNTRDVSQVKQYVQKQFQKFLTSKVSLQDCIFAREYRGLGGYKPGARVPALEITKRFLKKDRRAEPRPGDRVPYVIVYGSPGEPLFQLVKHPEEVLLNPNLRINSLYYINNAIIPSLQRVFGLIGIDVKSWYISLPKMSIGYQDTFCDNQTLKKGRISHYFNSSLCPVCSEQTSSGLCSNCKDNPQATIVTITERIKNMDMLRHQLTEICCSCMGTSDNLSQCISLDCPIFFQLAQNMKELQYVPYIKKLSGLSLDF